VDVDYRKELQRRDSLPGSPGAPPSVAPEAAADALKEENQEIVDSAESLIFVPEKEPDPKLPDPELSRAVQGCRDRKSHSSSPQ
jgi:hypothetical protein